MGITKKGMYFSFDALLALAIMSASLMALMTMMDTQSPEFDITTSEQQQVQENAQDMLTQASILTYQSYEQSFQDELLQETVMDEEDLERTILEGTAFLWASGNRTYAAEAVERFTEDKKPENKELRVEVSEGGEEFPPIYETTDETPDPDKQVATTSSIISGFRLNETSEGFRARARVLQAQAQNSEVIPISPAGTILEGPPGNTEFTVQQEMEITGDQIEEATLDIAISDGPSDGQRSLSINGNDVGFGDELYSQGEMTYYRNEEVDDVIDEPGTYNLEIQLASGQNVEEATRLQPGSRLQVQKLDTPEELESGMRNVEKNVQDITSSVTGGAGQDEAGITTVEEFSIPENSEIEDIDLNLAFEDLATNTGEDWDIQILLNGENIYEETAGNPNLVDSVDITEETQRGSNTLVFNIQHDGEQDFWGGNNLRIVGDSSEEDYTHIEAEYEEFTLVDEAFRASIANEIGDPGTADNPYDFTQDIEYETVAEQNIYLSQAVGERSEVLRQDEEGQFETLFDSEQIGGQVPTLISLDPSDIDTGENQFRIRDQENPDSNILPYTLFETVVEAPTAVGYGAIFDTPEEAQEDAVERLEERLGALIDAEDIEIDEDDDVETIGGQPRLWGPANLKLVMWESDEGEQN